MSLWLKMANVDIKKAFEFTGEMKRKRNGNNRTFLGVERRVWNIAISRVIEAYTALRLRITVWLHLLSTCGIFAHFTLMTTLLPHPKVFFFFFPVIPIAQREKLGSGGRCLFQECRRPHPKPCPVTTVGVPSEEDGTTVPPRKCHEARAGEDGEVLRQPKCHLPVTRVSPWPPRPPHDTSGPRASLIWSPKSSPDPLKPYRSFSAPPTLL